LIQLVDVNAGLKAERVWHNTKNLSGFGFGFNRQSLPERFIHYLFEGCFTIRHPNLQCLRNIGIQS
jgi:hypothetical protein